jgi:hypothetical protein
VASEVLSGKEYIDKTGAKQTGTFTIDNELDTQIDLISQLRTVANELPDAGSGSDGSQTCTLKINVDEGRGGSISIIYRILYKSNDSYACWEFDGINSNNITIQDVDISSLVTIMLCESVNINYEGSGVEVCYEDVTNMNYVIGLPISSGIIEITFE